MNIVVTVDTSDLRRGSRNFQAAARRTPELIERGLDEISQERKDAISDAAPRQARRDDRYPEHLYRSFDIVREPGMRSIVTRQPEKFHYVTQGTRGGYEIHPRFKKALYWPGLSHPIPYVGDPYTSNHPGISRPNSFVDRAMAEVGTRADVSAFTTITNKLAGIISSGVGRLAGLFRG